MPGTSTRHLDSGNLEHRALDSHADAEMELEGGPPAVGHAVLAEQVGAAAEVFPGRRDSLWLVEGADALVDYDLVVLVGGAEESSVAVGPHRDRQLVARHHRQRESGVHRAEARGIAGA